MNRDICPSQRVWDQISWIQPGKKRLVMKSKMIVLKAASLEVSEHLHTADPFMTNTKGYIYEEILDVPLKYQEQITPNISNVGMLVLMVLTGDSCLTGYCRQLRW